MDVGAHSVAQLAKFVEEQIYRGTRNGRSAYVSSHFSERGEAVCSHQELLRTITCGDYSPREQ